MMQSKTELTKTDTSLSRSDDDLETVPPLTLRSGLWTPLLIYVILYAASYWICHIFKLVAIGTAFLPPVIAVLVASLFSRRKNNRRQNLTLSMAGVELHSLKNPSGKKVTPWSSLKLVGLGKSAWEAPAMFKGKSRMLPVVLDFSGIIDVTLDINQMTEVEQHHFFRLISRCVPQSALTPEVLYMQVQSLLGNTPSSDGFTQIWSQEFDRRFELANHISLAPGHSLGNGRYTVELTLATRMSSSTYLVSSKDGKRYFIKELVVPVGADDAVLSKILEQFNREAKILASLSHPSIVAVLDHFVENDRSYMVMECAQGMNLREYVRSKQCIDDQTIVSIARQTLEVLEYLHGQNPPVLHRDITPDNIVYFFDQDKLKVVDFGASNIYKSQGTGTLIGKRSYMPPEQFKGKATPASDVYAFGSTLLFLLTGEDPPGMSKSPEKPERADAKIFALAQSCIEFDQENRPSVDDLIVSFENISNERLSKDRQSKEPEASTNV